MCALHLHAQPSCPCESSAQASEWVVLKTHPRQWKQNIKALSSHPWVTSVTASHERLLGLKTFSPVWPGAHCARAAAGGSVDRKEIPELSLSSSGKKTSSEASSEPLALWASVSSGLVPKTALQLCIPGYQLTRHTQARLSWRTRDPGQSHPAHSPHSRSHVDTARGEQP